MLEELLVAEKATRQTKRGDPFAFDWSQRTLPTSVWNETREVLAVAPEAADEWETIAAAFARIDELNWAMAPRSRTVDPTEALLKSFPAIHEEIVAASQALRGLTNLS
jgi:hypothetical protein